MVASLKPDRAAHAHHRHEAPVAAVAEGAARAAASARRRPGGPSPPRAPRRRGRRRRRTAAGARRAASPATTAAPQVRGPGRDPPRACRGCATRRRSTGRADPSSPAGSGPGRHPGPGPARATPRSMAADDLRRLGSDEPRGDRGDQVLQHELLLQGLLEGLPLGDVRAGHEDAPGLEVRPGVALHPSGSCRRALAPAPPPRPRRRPSRSSASSSSSRGRSSGWNRSRNEEPTSSSGDQPKRALPGPAQPRGSSCRGRGRRAGRWTCQEPLRRGSSRRSSCLRRIHRRSVTTAAYSTRRRPLGAMLGSASGRSTTNSVRWAGKTCSDRSTGRPSGVEVVRSHAQHRRPHRHGQQLGVGGRRRARRRSSAPRRRAARRAARRTAPAPRRPGRVGAQVLRAPHRDPGEGLAVGQVEAPHLEHGGRTEDLAGPGRRGHEPEVEDRGARSARRTRRAGPRSCRGGRATGAAGRPPRTSRTPGGRRPGPRRAGPPAPCGP